MERKKNKNKIKVIAIITAMILMIFNDMGNIAEAKEEGDYQYNVSRDKITITKYLGDDTNVEIPKTIEGKPVTGIANVVFSGKGLESVTIPETVETIGVSAFNKNNLTSIKLPDGLTELKDNTFRDNNIKEVTIPKNVKKIGNAVFYNNDIKELRLTDGLEEIGYSAFTKNSIENLTLPSTLKKIGYLVFSGNMIEELHLNDGLEEIGYNAFEHNNLTYAVIPESVKKMGANIFIYNKTEKEYFYIYGKEGTEAEKYAKTYKHTFNKEADVEFENNGSDTWKKEHSTKVTANGYKQDTLEYTWSDRKTKPNNWNPFKSGNTFTLKGKTGEYYLHVKGENLLGEETYKISNEFLIDNTKPTIQTIQNESNITNKPVTIYVNADDTHSGLKSIKYLGDNMVKNGDFSKESENWIEFVGESQFEKGKVTLADNKVVGKNRIKQENAFKDDVEDVSYYAEVTARGKGTLNVRYGSTGENQENYKKDMESETIYKTYKIRLDRNEKSTNNLIVEKIGDGNIEIKDIKVFSEMDIENGEITVNQNGNYNFIAEDNVGNIEKVTHRVSNIEDKKPEIEITQDINTWTNKNVMLTVKPTDNSSEIKSITYLGNNMIKNGDFSKGNENWNTEVGAGGIARIENGIAILDDNTVKQNKISNIGAFVDDAEGVTYYAEVIARGKGTLNTRYAQNSGGQVDTYQQEMESETEYKTYRFKLNRNERSTDNLNIERLGYDGYIEIKEVKVFAEKDLTDSKLEVKENGQYTFIAEDVDGNITKKTHNVTNIDKESPKVEITQNTDEITHEDVTLTVKATDNLSGIGSIKYLGENMVKNGDFSKGQEDWNSNTGNPQVDNNGITFKDNGTSQSKVFQHDAFKENIHDTEYFAEVKAKGTGILNVRYRVDVSKGNTGDGQYEYKQKMESEYRTYRFKLNRLDISTDDLVIEKLGDGEINVKDIKVFAEKELTNRSLTVKENGIYNFVVEDKAGNITKSTHEVTNIVKGTSLIAPKDVDISTTRIEGNRQKVESNLTEMYVEDWKDDSNNWRVEVKAKQLKNTKTGKMLPKGTIELNGELATELQEGKGKLPTNSYTGYKGIDGNKVEILTGKGSKGKYQVNFKENALKVTIDPTTIETGKYETTMMWDMVTAP